MIDYLVIGGGIAGASVAYFLKTNSKSVAIADDTGFTASASLAAGAFINPVLGKPSAFKAFADEAFRFSTAFYEKNFGELFAKRGSIIYPKNEKTKEEFAAIAPFIPSKHHFLEEPPFDSLLKEGFALGAFFVEESGFINPKLLIDGLLKDVLRYDASISEIFFDNGVWNADGIEAKNIILAQGAKASLSKESYIDLQLPTLWGQKVKIKASVALPVVVSRGVHMVSFGSVCGIGATHVNVKEPIPADREASEALIREASKIVDIKEYEIIEEGCGMRSTSIDHFPLCGAVYDQTKTISRFPSLAHGARLNKEGPIGINNLYIHTGHGIRAFMLAPYTAKILVDFMLNNTPPPRNIDPARLLFRYFKKRLNA